LNPGQVATLTVQFDPAAAGPATGQLIIISNSSTGGTAVISLSGTGTSVPAAGAQTYAWVWMGGSNTTNQPGEYRALDTPSVGSFPGSRYCSSSGADSYGNVWLLGGIGYDSSDSEGTLNDLWEFNSSTQQWTWVSGSSTVQGAGFGVYGTLGAPTAASLPGGRYCANSWTDSSGNLWIFGGEGYDSTGAEVLLNDLWEFNPYTQEWAWMGGISTAQEPGAEAGVYGTLGTPAAGNFPGARAGAVSWTDRSGSLWLFGGGGVDSTDTLGQLNDLWEFNPSTLEWAWMDGSSTVPSPSNGQPGVYGTLGTPAAGNVPGGRQQAVSWTDGGGNLWLFGGGGTDSAGTNGELNDLWEFNPSTGEWTWMSGSSTVPDDYLGQPGVYGTLGIPAADNVPGGRSWASSWTDSSGNLWLLGGTGYDSTGVYGYLNDLWEFNPSTRKWAWMGGDSICGGQPGVYGTLGAPTAASFPGGRYGATSWTDSSGNFWLLGGMGYDSTGAFSELNDLWEQRMPGT
jgi:N-acetylneuraminic acid mutarotase